MVTLSGIRHLFQSLSTVTLSATSQAMLQSASQTCRHVQRPPWHGNMPDTARALSGLVQTDETTVSKLKKSHPLSPEQLSQCDWPIRKAQHLSSHMMVARAKAALSMRDRSSAAHALEMFLQQLQHWAQEHPDKFDSIVSSVALLSVTHLAAKALDWGAPQNPLVPSIAAMLIKTNLRQISAASNQSVCNVFWACGRLQIRPDDVHPGFEDQLVQRFIDTQASATLQGASNVLKACEVLCLNPRDGLVLELLVQVMKRHLSAESFESKYHMQHLSVIMGSFACLQLHIQPAFAQLIVTEFYQGLLHGADDPNGVSVMLWACASLGYLPPPYMLECLKKSYATSKKPNLLKCNDSTVLWSLAVLGVLDMELFKMLILRRPRQLQQIADVQRMHQALHTLRPLDNMSAAYTEWSEVAHHVQLEWPLRRQPAGRSRFEDRIYYMLQQMGYEVIAGHDSEDGLHPIDIALLPQAKVPCKVAIEADGEYHFLYESYKLDKGPHAVRPNGSTLFRNAVLEDQGWHVVVVPWFEWKYLLSYTARVAYLENKIGHVVLQHALNARLQHQTC